MSTWRPAPDDMQGLRVAAIIDGGEVTGPLRQLAALVAPLAARGVSLMPIVFQRAGKSGNAHIEFLRRHGIEPHVLRDKGAFDPAPVRQFRHFVREWRPHIVQTHGYRPTAVAWWSGRAGRDWRWLGWHHGITSENWKVRLYHALDRLLLPHADQLIVVAGSQADRFRRARGRIEVIHNAVIDAPPVSDALVDRVPETPLRPVIAVVGRLSPEKGVDVMFRALALMQDAGVRPSLLLAGEGPERQVLERLAAELDVSAQVHFLGHVSEVAAVYRRADLVVLPSRSEGLPNSLLEALRADRPVVSTAVGAVPEVLTDALAGILVPPEDPQALAQGILLALQTLGSEPARAARSATLERFSLATRVERHMSLYRRMTSQVSEARLL